MDYLPKAPDSEFKQYLYDNFSRVGKALASPQRLVLLNVLCQGEHSVESLARESGLSAANVSQHLQMLKSVNLVRQRKDGKFVFYSLADEETCLFFVAFRKFVYGRVPEMESALRAVHGAPSRRDALTVTELSERLGDRDIYLIDVRPQEEFEAAHLPGAVSIPLAELRDSLADLPRDKEIITYCRGLFCILADEAVTILLDAGFNANRLDSGLLDWKLAGHPVETS